MLLTSYLFRIPVYLFIWGKWLFKWTTKIFDDFSCHREKICSFWETCILSSRKFLADISPPIVDTQLWCRRAAEADVWLCYHPSNKTDVWLCCIQQSRCCYHTAIIICSDEIRDLAMLDFTRLSSLGIKQINMQASKSAHTLTKLNIQLQGLGTPT